MVFYLSIIILGLIIALWFLFQEEKTPQKQIKDEPPNLLKRLGLDEDLDHKGPLSEQGIPSVSPPTSLKPSEIKQEAHKEKDIPIGDVDDISHAVAFQELKDKHERLEKLFEEKSQEFEKLDKALAGELRAKKEFNKIKDLLEKELKEIKDKSHKSHLELGASKAETESYKRRATQLEEKIVSKEKEIKDKEKEIDGFIKRLETFTQPKVAPTPTPLVEPVPLKPKTEEIKPAPIPSQPEQPKIPLPESKQETSVEQKPEIKLPEGVSEEKPQKKPAAQPQEQKVPELPPVQVEPQTEPAASNPAQPPEAKTEVISEKTDAKPAATKFKDTKDLRIPTIIRQAPRQK